MNEEHRLHFPKPSQAKPSPSTAPLTCILLSSSTPSSFLFLSSLLSCLPLTILVPSSLSSSLFISLSLSLSLCVSHRGLHHRGKTRNTHRNENGRRPKCVIEAAHMEHHRAVAAVGEGDAGVDGMHCSFHPFNAAGGGGGICAFCLQEKLGKLVSSSLAFPSQRNSSSPSASPSFRSDDVVPSTVSFGSSSSMPRQGHDEHHAKQSKVASFLAKKKKKKGTVVEEEEAPSMVFQRSRSIAFSAATPQSCHFYDVGGQVYSPRKRGGFWSFISLSSSSRPHNARDRDSGHSLSRIGQAVVEEDNVVVSANNGVSASSFESHKVSRSRSVGCGSRSFSGDFFERISTGFIGDCTTLRRVESHREGKPPRASTSTTSEAHHHPHQCMKERVRCGGIFGGFAIANTTNSSSSISSSSACSSSYWVSSSSNSAEDNVNHSGASSKPTVYSHHHGRSKSWGWALASPMRAFSRPSSGKRNAGAAIKPTSGLNGASLLAVGG